jgi:toxin YoeB
MYKIEILPRADRDIHDYWKAGNKTAIKNIQLIFKEFEIHPYTGIGQSEPLKYELTGYWSRHIDKKNRIIYRIEEEKIKVIIVSAMGHYK